MAFPGVYAISCDGKTVKSGLFKSHDAICDSIKAQPPGVYDADEVLPMDPNSVVNAEYYGEFTRHENGEVTYSERSTAPLY